MSDSDSSLHGASRGGLLALLRFWLGAGSFLVAAVAAAFFIEPRLPFPPVPDLAARLHYFAEHESEFDTVFIGSSRFRHHIIPHEFDAATAAAGVPTHSFNLGYSGMWPPESFYFLRQVLALRSPYLHRVIIELMDYRFGEWENKPLTMRLVYWHDWRHTAMALRIFLDSSLPPLEKGQELLTHAKLFVQRMLSPGTGADWLEDRYFPTKTHEGRDWVDRAGFDPESQGGAWTAGPTAELANQVEAVKRSLPPQPLRPAFAVALRDLLDDIHRAGVQPIFVISMSVRPEENLMQGLPDGLTILRFNRPDLYPRLYEPATHYDIGHLNENGAHEFTRVLAQQFVEQEASR